MMAQSALLIDVGNTRLKWAVLRDGVLGPQHAQSYADWSDNEFGAYVLGHAGRQPRVLVANVGGERIAGLIDRAVFKSWDIKAEFPQSTARAGGIENAYDEPAKLGVDRWAAMIGAHAMGVGPACVVSVGTAMTIDGVTESGKHLGGLILPGPDLMVSSLMRNTSEIAVRAESGQTRDVLFADNTRGAIHQGAAHALAALVDRAMHTLEQSCGKRPALVMTGGAAPRIAHLVADPLQQVPDLVLRGLAVLADEV
ncbi:MAG: type III pantothenate kinase [Steroidobacteraceae bacterium]